METVVTSAEKDRNAILRKYKTYRWSVFLSATVGYSFFYVCRLSLGILKKPIVDAQIFDEAQLGYIGSALFYMYAIGKFTNGFLADRLNIRKFMAIGLMASALINIALGSLPGMLWFTVLWGLNGWFQSIGSPPCAIAITRWYSSKEKGTYYGIWSASHSIGKGLANFVVPVFVTGFILLGLKVGGLGAGFISTGVIGIIGAIIVWFFMYESPESKGLPSTAVLYNEEVKQFSAKAEDTVKKEQWDVLKNPAIWILAASSMLMYISRYALDGWGVYYFQNEKGYTLLQASSFITINAVFGIAGTILGGIISDRFLKGDRNLIALVAGLLNVSGIALFLYYPNGNVVADALSMVLFGLGIGTLVTFIGGLMAIDIVSKKATGMAMGLVGFTSYIGGALAESISGVLIKSHKTVVNGVARYDFEMVRYFWLGAAVLSMVLVLFVWNAKRKNE